MKAVVAHGTGAPDVLGIEEVPDPVPARGEVVIEIAATAVNAAHLLPVSRGVSLHNAAALPEAACAVWSMLFEAGGLRRGQSVLIHGAASGIGTMATRLARHFGAFVIVTAGGEPKLSACRGTAEWANSTCALSWPKRGTVHSAGLRGRDSPSKADIVRQVREHVWPLIEAGVVHPEIDSTFDLIDVAEAHRRVEESSHIGKVVIRVR